MSKRSPSVVIGDILKCLEHIEMYTANLSFDHFSTNFMVTEACLYNIQIIGEAVNQLPDEVKMANPKIPWTLIKGMRNRLIDEYFGTDLALVWNTIKNDLPPFTTELRAIQEQLIKEKS